MQTRYNMEKVFLGVLAGAAELGHIRVVRATLDFIYYAHFESHTTDSLRKLEEAWITFHQNLDYFVSFCFSDVHQFTSASHPNARATLPNRRPARIKHAGRFTLRWFRNTPSLGVEFLSGSCYYIKL